MEEEEEHVECSTDICQKAKKNRNRKGSGQDMLPRTVPKPSDLPLVRPHPPYTNSLSTAASYYKTVKG